MKKRLLSIAVAALSAATAMAQPMMVYEPSVTQGTYTPLESPTLISLGATGLDVNSKVYGPDGTVDNGTAAKGFPIGFDFKYNSRQMSHVLIGFHGFIALGNGEVTVSDSSDPYFIFSKNINIAGMVYRSACAAINSTKVGYATVGEAPNRQFVVEYTDMQIGVNGWEGYAARDTVCLQIRLHETSGKVEIITKGFEPSAAVAADLNWNDMFKIGICGINKDMTCKASSFTDDSFADNDELGISWRAESYPADGQTYAFFPPEDCEKPATSPTALQLSATSLAMSGSFTPSSDADHYLVAISKQPSMDVMPQDGTFYSANDSIGQARVISYAEGTEFETGDILAEGTQYYAYVFATNSYCMFGPKYNTANILTGSIFTCPPAPAELCVVSTDSTSAVISVKPNDADNDVIIGYTTMPKINDNDQLQFGGTFGQPTGNYAAGDSITGGGYVAYAGKGSDNIQLNNLSSSSIYHLAAWSRESSGNYSSTKIETDMHTVATLPWDINFGKSYQATGWNKSDEEWTTYQDGELLYNIKTADAVDGIVTWIESPEIYLPKGTNRLIFDLSMSAYIGYKPGPYLFNDRDTIRLQVTTDGKEYQTFKEYTIDNKPVFESSNSTLNFTNAFTEGNGQKGRIRIWMKLYGAPKSTFTNMRLEQKKACDYPINVHAVSSTIVGDRATVEWIPQGEEDAWDIRYRIIGNDGQPEEWGEPITVRATKHEIAGLKGATTYEAQVRARCSLESQSDWSKGAKFVSGLAIPFTKYFNESNSLDDGWRSVMGEMSDTQNFSLDNAESSYGWSMASGMMSEVPYLGYGAYYEQLNDWFITPVLDLGDGGVNYIADFTLTTTYDSGDASDVEYKIVVAPDGNTFSNDNVVLSFKKADLPALDESKTFSAPIKGYKGNVRLGLYITGGYVGVPNLKLNSVAVRYSCPNDIVAKADIVSENSIHVSWDSQAAEWLVAFCKQGEERPEYTVVTEPEFAAGDLERHTVYELYITKCCSEDDTAKVVKMEIMTLGDPCPMPTGIKVTPKKYSATIAWTSEANAYNVRYRTKGTTAWAEELVTGTSIVIGGLKDDTEYEYAIQAMCSKAENDTSDYTPAASFLTLPETCFKPTGIAVAPSWNMATVTWQGEADKYEMCYRKEGDGEWTSSIIPGFTADINGLAPETDYQLRMRSICAEGDSSLWTDPQVFTTTAEPVCLTPTNLTADNLTDHSATLSWTADAGNLSWNLRYRDADVTSWTTIEGLNATSYELDGLKPNTLYIWSVMATCEAERTSKWSAQNRFTSDGTDGIDAVGINALTVFAKGNIINVVNPEGGVITMVGIYNADGQLEGQYRVNTTDNVFIPVSSHGVKIVKVQGKNTGKTARVIVK